MDVSITSLTGAIAPPALSRPDSAVEVAASSRSVSSTVDTNSLHSARLSAVVDLIGRLTGRQVKLVPPAAYFVSAPIHEEIAPVELLAPLGLASQLAEEPGPLEVDITSVLRTGTAERMLLDQKPLGQLQLRAALDVEL